MADFIDSLSDDELDSFGNIIDEGFIVSLRNKPIDSVKKTARAIDDIFSKAPETDEPILIYKTFQGQGVDQYLQGGTLTENAYLMGSIKEPSQTPLNAVTLAILVPDGIPYIQVEDSIFLPRGVTMEIDPSETDVAQAWITGVVSIEL